MTALRPTTVEVDGNAIRDNVAALRAHVSPALLCAVVKADGYGHGAVGSARAAVLGGATWLAVALVEEGVALRDAGIDVPILVLSEQSAAALDPLVVNGLTATVASVEGVTALAAAASRAGMSADAHLKIDTGMHRMGALPETAPAVADALRANVGLLHWTGTWTHFAVADEPTNPATKVQHEKFISALTILRDRGHDVGLVHAANSAGALAHQDMHHGMVRCGIAIYGQAPDIALDPGPYGVALRPAVRLTTRVTALRVLQPGERVSYGLTYEVRAPTVIATVPAGYADGVPRRLYDVGGEVIVRGQRHPIAGRITMDQMMIDCGPPDSLGVVIGDPVVLLGRQGDAEVTAWEWATRLGTIAYEIVCALRMRAPRVQSGAGTETGTWD